MIEQLRLRTKQAHLELDHLVYPLIRDVQTLSQYHDLLRVFYGYFQPVYHRLDLYLNESIVPGYNARRKPAWILADIQSTATGINQDKICFCDDIPAIHNAVHAFGAMYVLEGSTMGGTIISKKLQENLNRKDGFSFFEAYQEMNPAQWGTFIKAMSENEANHKAEEELICTAVLTFELFTNWIKKYYGGTK